MALGGPFNRRFVAMSFFMCLERGFLARPQGGLGPSPRPPGDLLQEILYNRFRPEHFPDTGVEIKRQKRRTRAGNDAPE